ncbi:MAG: omptin family outer membrane protease [Nitrospirae bacterium]|nr:omptin family outer membrane protease [Candidatus Troglogloeales bacterium]
MDFCKSHYIFSFLVFLASLIFALPSYGDEVSFPSPTEAFPRFDISLQAGIIHGTTKELVFDQGQKISEIAWEMKPIIFTGYTVGTNLNKRVAMHFSYGSGVNDHLGYVEDSDFQDGIKSSFSKHTATLERAYLADLDLGYDFLKRDPIIVTGILGYSLRKIKMGAKDGFVESPPGSTPKDVFGMGIEYEQIYKFPYIGIALDYALQEKLTLNLSTLYSNQVAIDTLDNHLKRGIDFYDTMRGGVYYAFGPSVNFRIGQNSVLSVSSLYMKINEIKGDSYSVNTTTGERSSTRENGAGTSFNAYTVILSWTVLM